MSSSTYGDLIRLGARKLKSAGIDDPVREARHLLQVCSRMSAASLIAQENDQVSTSAQTAFQEVLDRRVAREPLAHIIGRADFYGLSLRSNARALVPRPDSECVVDLALDYISEVADWRVADLGTGTGALLAALMINRPRMTGLAIEASPDAVELAEENFRELNISTRVKVFAGTWSDWGEWETCDLIISNPPYIVSDVIETLEPEVRQYDPIKALDGGVDGLDAYREITTIGARKMRPGAILVLEIGYDQRASVSALLKGAGFKDFQHRQDLGGNDRAIAAIKS